AVRRHFSAAIAPRGTVSQRAGTFSKRQILRNLGARAGRRRHAMLEELIGQALGQYQIMELIGQGGMAPVYKAYQPPLDRYSAIEALTTRVDNAQDQDLLQRFYIEARLIAKLAHPNIVPVHDFGEDQGWAYIVMEHIAGGTVREQMGKAESMHARL